MMASKKAQEFFEDTLRHVEADVDDLVIAMEGPTKVGRTKARPKLRRPFSLGIH